MKIAGLAAAAALIAAPAWAQTPAAPAPAAASTGLSAEAMLLPGATLAPDCGNLYNLAGRAFCVSAPMAGMSDLAEAYVVHLGTMGWLSAGGDENRVVFVRRREGGGCDGLQMQAFYDTSRPVGPASLGYLGFGQIPGDVCAARPAAPATVAPAQ